MSTEYEPGTVAVATVRGLERVQVIRTSDHPDGGNGWVSATSVAAYYTHRDQHVTDVRPLVVLDLIPEQVEIVCRVLRDGMSGGRSVVADQIEAQTKPPRIPEPGLWGVVEASWAGSNERFTFVRIATGTAHDWQVTEDGSWADWDELHDPTLIREGLS